MDGATEGLGSDSAARDSLTVMDDEVGEEMFAQEEAQGIRPAPRPRAQALDDGGQEQDDERPLPDGFAAAARKADPTVMEDPEPGEDGEPAAAGAEGEQAGEGGAPPAESDLLPHEQILQQQGQQASEIPQWVAPVMQPLVEHQAQLSQAMTGLYKLLERTDAQASERVARAQLEATRPQPPPDGSSPQDMAVYQAREDAWNLRQQFLAQNNEFATLKNQLLEISQRSNQAAQQREMAAIQAQFEAQYKAEVGNALINPKYAFLHNPKVAPYFYNTYKDACRKAQRILPLAPYADRFARDMGAPPAAAKPPAPTQTQERADRLTAQRERVRSGKHQPPVMGQSRTGKQKAPPPGPDREAFRRKMRAMGVRLP